MKRFLLLAFLILNSAFTFLPAFAQTVNLQNSLSIFNTLVDCTSEDQMIKKCNFYKFKDLGIHDDFYVYEAPDGNTIRFRIDRKENGQQIPVIEIITTQNRNKIEKHLTKMGYKKEGKIYIRSHKYGITQTYCKIEKADSNKTKLLATKTSTP